MRNTRCFWGPWAQSARRRAKSSLDRSLPSTHRAARLAPEGSLARMARASRARAWVI